MINHIVLLEQMNLNGKLHDFIECMNPENLIVSLAEGCLTWISRSHELAIY